MINIHKNTPDGDGGDVLVFLTGQDEIENLESLLKRSLEDVKSFSQQILQVSGVLI